MMETDLRKVAEPPGIKTSSSQLQEQEAAEVKGHPGEKCHPAKLLWGNSPSVDPGRVSWCKYEQGKA